MPDKARSTGRIALHAPPTEQEESKARNYETCDIRLRQTSFDSSPLDSIDSPIQVQVRGMNLDSSLNDRVSHIMSPKTFKSQESKDEKHENNYRFSKNDQ